MQESLSAVAAVGLGIGAEDDGCGMLGFGLDDRMYQRQ
jgi:hypothetical protein